MSEIKIAPERKLTDRDLRRVFWRSCMLDSSWNYERQQNIGYSFGIVPVIEKVYEPGSEKQKRAYARSLDFMAITPQLSTLLMGIDAAMEEENAANDEFDDSAITAVKTSLMGPLAGIGDSLIVGTLIPILLGIAMGLSQGGSVLGPIFYIVVWNLLAYFGMRFAYYRGYKLGGDAVEALVGPNAQALREAIVMVGTIVIGAVDATWVSITTALTLPGGGTLQGTLDGIYPKLLPLIFTIFCWWLMAKKKVSPIITMLILLVIAFVGALCGFFGAATIATAA